ncbi:MAG: creatininase family protein, partial [Pseudomonadota bacterium]
MTASGRIRYWQDLTSPEIEAQDPGRTIAILPVGAIEQHGPHLPVGVDAMIVQGILAQAMKTMASPVQALALPIMPIGKSD